MFFHTSVICVHLLSYLCHLCLRDLLVCPPHSLPSSFCGPRKHTHARARAHTHTQTVCPACPSLALYNIYIYIYMQVCVCVCVYCVGAGHTRARVRRLTSCPRGRQSFIDTNRGGGSGGGGGGGVSKTCSMDLRHVLCMGQAKTCSKTCSMHGVCMCESKTCSVHGACVWS
jgi:hypothetical protein